MTSTPETWLRCLLEAVGWSGRAVACQPGALTEGLGAWGAAGAPRHELGGQAASFALNGAWREDPPARTPRRKHVVLELLLCPLSPQSSGVRASPKGRSLT